MVRVPVGDPLGTPGWGGGLALGGVIIFLDVVFSGGLALDFLLPPNELIIDVDRMGFRKGCKLTLEAAMIRIEAANIWEVVPTVSYFFSLT